MKAKIVDLLNSNPILNNLFSQKLNGAVAFKLSQIIQESSYKLKNFESVREKLITDNNGVWNEEESKYKFENPEDEAKVSKEFDELIMDEVEVPARFLTLDDLEKIPEVSPEEMRILSWAVEK